MRTEWRYYNGDVEHTELPEQVPPGRVVVDTLSPTGIKVEREMWLDTELFARGVVVYREVAK